MAYENLLKHWTSGEGDDGAVVSERQGLAEAVLKGIIDKAVAGDVGAAEWLAVRELLILPNDLPHWRRDRKVTVNFVSSDDKRETVDGQETD